MKGTVILAVAVLVVLVSPVLVWSQCGLCGDVYGDGDVTSGDVSMLLEYLVLGGTLNCPDYGDVDGYPGITLNDYWVLVAHKFITQQPISCPPTPGAEPPQSGDSIWFQHTWIPVAASTDKWRVPLWGKDVSNVVGFSIPIEFSLPGHTLELDSISGQDSRYSSVESMIDNPNSRAIVYGAATGPGEGIIAELFFAIDPPVSDAQIEIEIGTYPPSHELIYTCLASNEYYGVRPAAVTPTCESWGDVNNTGGESTIGDISQMNAYLLITGVAPALPFQGDVTGDCVLDILDIHSMICEQYVCTGGPWNNDCCNLLGGPQPLFTCCDPHKRSLGDPGAPLDCAIVTFEGSDIVVTGVGPACPGGTRVYPADQEVWEGIRMDLEQVDLSYSDMEARFRFVGYMWPASVPPDPDDYIAESSWLLGSVVARETTGGAELEADFEAVGYSDILVQGYRNDVLLGEGYVAGGGVVADLAAIGGMPSITSLEAAGVRPYSATLYLDEDVSLTIASYPPVTMTANRIKLVVPDDTVSFDGAGPVDIQVDAPGSFAVRNIEEWEPTCYSYADLNFSDPVKHCGWMTIGDVSLLTAYLILGDPAPPGLYEADVTGDCVIDILDLVAMYCMAPAGPWDPGACSMLGGECPLAVCCDPISRFAGEPYARLGEAALTMVGSAVRVEPVGNGGLDGIRCYPSDDTPSRGTRLRLSNVDLAPDGAGISFRSTGYYWPGPDFDHINGAGVVGEFSLRTDNGTILVGADFSSAGDPDVVIRAYRGGALAAAVEVPGGDAVAELTAITDLPKLDKAAVLKKNRNELEISFDRPVSIEFPGSPGTPVSTIDRLQFIADDATDTFNGIGPLDIAGTGLGWFEVDKVSFDFCCSGLVGDANSSGDDLPTIGDISTMIDAAIIRVDLDCVGIIDCFSEADVNQTGGFDPVCDDVTIGDISLLIDYLFITGPENMELFHCLDATGD